MCRVLGAEVQIKLFPIDLNTALARDAARERSVGPDVVRRFHGMFEQMDPLTDTFVSDTLKGKDGNVQ